MKSEAVKLLTVLEYAKTEKISRQAVYQRMKNSKWKSEHCQEIDGKLYIDLSTFPEEQEAEEPEDDKAIVRDVEKLTMRLTALERENEILKNQIVEKDQQIQGLIAGWRECQATGAMKRLESGTAAADREPERRSVFSKILKIGKR